MAPAVAIAQKALPPVSKGEYFTPDQVIAAMHESRGVLNRAAEILGCSRRCVFDYCERYPEVAQARLDGRQMLADLSEQSLAFCVEQSSELPVKLAASKFVLQTLAKDRGYVLPASSMTAVQVNGAGNVRVIQVDSSGPVGELGDADLVSQMKALVSSTDG